MTLINARKILALAVIAGTVSLHGTPTPAQDFSTTHRVELTRVADRKAVFATVETVDTTIARARIAGTMGSLVVDEGSQVAAGQVIAQVTDPKLTLELAAIEARIEALKSERALAELDLDRATQLRKTGAASQARLDESRTNLQVVDRNIRAMAADSAVLLERLREGAVLAPASGRVLRVDATDGQVIMAGEPIATIADETYVLRMRVPERHARFMAQGQSVLVGARGRVDTDDETRSLGKIVKVYPEMDRGRVVADVAVDGLGDYFVGERTRVYISTGERAVYVIPDSFVSHRFGLAYVQIQGEGEVVIEPGQRIDGGLEILSGVREGDLLLPPAKE